MWCVGCTTPTDWWSSKTMRGSGTRGDIAQACAHLRPLARAETSLEVQRGKQARPKQQPVVVDLSACPLRLS